MTASIKFTVGELKELIGVELPCFVKSNATALDMLGGEDMLQKTFESDSKSMQLRLPTKDQVRQNLTGTQVIKNGVLIKVRRRKVPETETESQNIMVEVVGSVKKSYVFGYPADYQFLPMSTDPKYYTSRSAVANPPVLEVVPSSFCRVHNTNANQFLYMYDNLKPTMSKQAKKGREIAQANARSAKQLIGGGGERSISYVSQGGEITYRKRHPDAGLTAFVRYQDPIPTGHPSGEQPLRWSKTGSAASRGQTIHKGTVLIQKLKEIFAVTPMLTVQQLHGLLNLSPRDRFLFKDCLPYVAYCFSQGPWRSMWVRFGYDPKLHPEARFCQMVTFRLAPLVFQEVSTLLYNHIGASRASGKIVDLDTLTVRDVTSAELGVTGKTQHGRMPFAMFGLAMRHQFSVQVSLLADEGLFGFVRRMRPQSHCNGHNGWYTLSSISGLRNLVLKRMSEQMDAFLSQSGEMRFSKGPILNPVSQAFMPTFDGQAVNEYLTSAPNAEEAPMTTEDFIAQLQSQQSQAQTHGSQLLPTPAPAHPNHLFYWMRRYLLSAAETQFLAQHNPSTGQMLLPQFDYLQNNGDGADKEGEDGGEEVAAMEVDGNEFYAQHKARKPPRGSTGGNGRQRGVAAATSATSSARTAAVAGGGGNSSRRGAAAMGSSSGRTGGSSGRGGGNGGVSSSSSCSNLFNFNEIEAFDVFGEEDEEGGGGDYEEEEEDCEEGGAADGFYGEEEDADRMDDDDQSDDDERPAAVAEESLDADQVDFSFDTMEALLRQTQGSSNHQQVQSSPQSFNNAFGSAATTSASATGGSGRDEVADFMGIIQRVIHNSNGGDSNNNSSNKAK